MSYEKLKRQVDNYYAYRMTVDDGNKVGGSSGFGSFIIKVVMVLIVLSIIGHIIG